MECTALVVREDYWQGVLDFQCRIRGIQTMTLDELERCKNIIIHLAELASKAIRQLIDVMAQFANELVIVVKDTLSETIAALSRFMDELEPSDDYNTILNKMKNRWMYVQEQKAIKERQYIKNCFKLARMHPCIKNHVRK